MFQVDEIPITAKSLIVTLMGTGILGVIAAGMLAVANDARIAIGVAEQHGQELLLIRGEMAAIHSQLLERTMDRYTARDAENHEKYIDRRVTELEKKLDENR
jgi:hypothetical protein